MSGVVYRLCHNDHKVVEDFLSRRPEGVAGILLDPKWAHEQAGAAEAARAAGVPVYFEPATERLVAPGFEVASSEYTHTVWDPQELVASPQRRRDLIEAVLRAHPESVTAITPPHFLVGDERSASLNAVLAQETSAHGEQSVRAIVLVQRSYATKDPAALAHAYVAAGIEHVELRLTPVGGEGESLAKISSVFMIARAFTDAGITVTMGQSGNLGHVAVVQGHAAEYSVGVGLLESVNHGAVMKRQTAPPKPRDPADGEEGNGPRGALAGIYLPGLAATVRRQVGKNLLGHSDLKLKVSCRLACCANSIEGPARNPRGHYLTTRAHEVSQVMDQPPAWRANAEAQRLERALQLRQMINEHYLTKDDQPLPTRTLQSLVDALRGEQPQRGSRTA
ncbi:hypothetical protein [Kineococcus aurantiacus]|uniref:Uncharacterized protein n=1 Tax=Kineococcus aurantiacus TaxID=37633 RepID=A0A7Y9J3A6_9ACTN|nr:hypothetical protein [Kineococcus aurantiacus]NYD25044.1 hypothetical protein [Kineococcus aurantiacus]